MHPHESAGAAEAARSTGATGTAPRSAEEAALLMAMHIGKRMRVRHPGDEVDASSVPLLHTLSCAGPVRLSDLAGRLHLDASTVSRHIRHLEEQGLVARADDPDDRRAARVEITDLGRKVLTGCMEQRKQRLGQALASWSRRDRDLLRELATRFVTDLNATDQPGGS